MSVKLTRRGFNLGGITIPAHRKATLNWQSGSPIQLKAQCINNLSQFEGAIRQSGKLYDAILNGSSCDQLFDQTPYKERLSLQFESLGSSINEGDDQEIETVLFDAISGEKILAEDLWMKASWLSFYEEDASFRFRFSFGVDLHEDVAADKNRQHFAALLTDKIFPESHIITQNSKLIETLSSLLDCASVNFVERIIYFNAPQGGAYLHHDRERGHAGVVYAQLSGQTFWLALTREQLLKELKDFINNCDKYSDWPDNFNESMKTDLRQLSVDSKRLIDELESFNNTLLIHLMNETKSFVLQLSNNGHGFIVNAGDMLLLPQETADKCCWHSVFTLGDEVGQALSFAIRRS